MAEVVFTQGTYSGELAGPMISRAILGADTIEKGLVTVMPNIKKKAVIQRIDDEITLAEPSADFAAANPNVAITERHLEPVEMHVMKEYTYKQLRQGWQAAQLNPGTLKSYEPTNDLAEFLKARMQDKTNIAIDKLMWRGKSATPEAQFAAPFLGLTQKWEADAALRVKEKSNVGALNISGITNAGVVTHAGYPAGYSVKTGDYVTLVGINGNQVLTGTTIGLNGASFVIRVLSATTFQLVDEKGLSVALTGITAATAGQAQYINDTNVLEIFAQTYTMIPEELIELPDWFWVIPMHVGKAYKIAQAKVANGAGSFFVGEKTLDFLTEKLTISRYIPKNSVAGYQKANVMVGTDLLSDTNEILLIDMKLSTGDLKYRYRSAMQFDVNYGFSEEIVYFRPAV